MLKEKRISVFQVAILKAQTPAALRRWLHQKGYEAPSSQEPALAAYIKKGWAFAAAKIAVPESALRRRPKDSLSLPYLGFRFRSKRLVIPTRLLSFTHHIPPGTLTYHYPIALVTKGPRRLIGVKQTPTHVTGKELWRNLNWWWPIATTGRTKRLHQSTVQYLQKVLHPSHQNGQARRLMFRDIKASYSRSLRTGSERHADALGTLFRHLYIEGPRAQKLLEHANRSALKKELSWGWLSHLRKLQLTYVAANLPMSRFRRNDLYTTLTRRKVRRRQIRYRYRKGATGFQEARLLSWRRLPPVFRKRPPLWVPLRSLYGNQHHLSPTPLHFSPATKHPLYHTLMPMLRQTPPPLKNIRRLGHSIRPVLAWIALSAKEPLVRGWSLAAIASFPGDKSFSMLSRFTKAPNVPRWLRQVAQAAMAKVKGTSLQAKARIHFPYHSWLHYPWKMHWLQRAKDGQMSFKETSQRCVSGNCGHRVLAREYLAQKASLKELLGGRNNIELNYLILKRLQAQGHAQLFSLLFSSPHTHTRKRAAAFLATLHLTGTKRLKQRFLHLIRFRPQATRLPWGLFLFIPELGWSQPQRQALQATLIHWQIWRHLRAHRGIDGALHQLFSSSRFRLPHDQRQMFKAARRKKLVAFWLKAWNKEVGCKTFTKMLQHHRALQPQKTKGVYRYYFFRHILKSSGCPVPALQRR